MTPESSPTKGEKNSQSRKPLKSKASASHEQDSNDHPLKNTEACLPEPQYRTVAGHVSRRANTSVAADPPPPPPPAPAQATSSNRRREQRRKAGGGGFGDDSDDSDSGDRKPGQGNGSPGAASRRSRPRAQNDDGEPSSADVFPRPSGPFQSKPMQFNKEEQERLDLRRELSVISSDWERLRQLRNYHSEQATEKRTLLLQYLRMHNKDWHPEAELLGHMGMDISTFDQRQDEYLRCSLHRAAVETITDKASAVMATTVQFIREVEEMIILGCENANPARRLNPESEADTRIETLSMALHCMVEAMASPERGSKLVDFDGYRKYHLSPNGFGIAREVFAKSIANKMMKYAEKSYLAPPEDRTPFLLRNRDLRGITTGYMEWLCEGVDIDSIEGCPTDLYDGLRALQRLKTLREGTQQVFMSQSEDVSRSFPLPVLLVMFKGDQPLRIQRVKHSELYSLGWKSDRPEPCYWRCSAIDVTVPGEQGTRRAVFKVDMNGAVLAIMGPARKWVYWDDVIKEPSRKSSGVKFS